MTRLVLPMPGSELHRGVGSRLAALPRTGILDALAVCHQFVTSGVHDAGNGVNLDQPRFHNPLWVRSLMVGTPAWTRTKDQLIKSQLLYQLSYRGILLDRQMPQRVARIGDEEGLARAHGRAIGKCPASRIPAAAAKRRTMSWTILRCARPHFTHESAP